MWESYKYTAYLADHLACLPSFDLQADAGSDKSSPDNFRFWVSPGRWSELVTAHVLATVSDMQPNYSNVQQLSLFICAEL